MLMAFDSDSLKVVYTLFIEVEISCVKVGIIKNRVFGI